MRVDRRSFLLQLAALPAWPQRASADTLIDGAKRTVSIPQRVTKVFAAGGPAAVMLYTLAPDLLVGWPRSLAEGACHFMRPDICARPVVGGLFGSGGTINTERLMHLAPDVIVDVGSLGGTFASIANRIEQQSGIPYALLDGNLNATEATYRQFARLVRREQAAEPLCAYVARTLDTVRERVAGIPFARRPRVYHARGARGLDTPRPGSINLDPFEILGVRNVASTLQSGYSVSIEQVLLWDPDVIVALDRDFIASLRFDVNWRPVSAVRSGRVHLAPALPFGWVNFVPSVNRVIGLWWLAKIFYPDEFPEDLRALAREFYTLFYHVTLTDEQIDRLVKT